MLLPLLLEFYCCFLACYKFTASSPTLRNCTAIASAATVLLLMLLPIEVLLLLLQLQGNLILLLLLEAIAATSRKKR